MMRVIGHGERDQTLTSGKERFVIAYGPYLPARSRYQRQADALARIVRLFSHQALNRPQDQLPG